MQKLSGIHFYINIGNFNQIILDEESKTGNVTHAIHALDTFFSSIEIFGKKLSKNFVVEKITGSRLHLYVVDDILQAFHVVEAVSVYAYKLSRYINVDIRKYQTLKDFLINVGVAYGQFYDFEFTANEGFAENTTIGYAANYAAKLQALTAFGRISISENIYNSLAPDEKELYERIDDKSIEKYDQDKYYSASLVSLRSPVAISDDDMAVAKQYADKHTLGEIDFAEVRGQLSFRNLSTTKCKKLRGIPVFADIRGFTSQFDAKDDNLDEMAKKTQQILSAMYQICIGNGGIHVQFQGDRELSLFHDIPLRTVNGDNKEEQKCYKAAVLAAMRIIDAVKPFSVHVGVGEDYGKLFATKIGARGEKDNILLGETVISADIMEDKYADKDQIAITETVYNGLKKQNPYLANYFKKTGNHYIASIGFQQYHQLLQKSQYLLKIHTLSVSRL